MTQSEWNLFDFMGEKLLLYLVLPFLLVISVQKFLESKGTGANSPTSNMTPPTHRIPAAYVPHGGGPLPILGHQPHEALVKWMSTFQEKYLSGQNKPTSILIISAHWEESVPTIQATPGTPSLYYDYYGFPEESYHLDYQLSSSPQLVKRVDELLTQANIPHAQNTKRGYDHGVFIPLKLMLPNNPKVEKIPVIQLSLVNTLDPMTHYKIGQALAPLRDEGVFILGSGMSFHARIQNGNKYSIPFHNYLNDALFKSKSANERRDKVCDWKKAPGGKESHPREEHLVPLFVILGSASPANSEEPGKVTEAFSDEVMGTRCAGYVFD